MPKLKRDSEGDTHANSTIASPQKKRKQSPIKQAAEEEGVDRTSRNPMLQFAAQASSTHLHVNGGILGSVPTGASPKTKKIGAANKQLKKRMHDDKAELVKVISGQAAGNHKTLAQLSMPLAAMSEDSRLQELRNKKSIWEKKLALLLAKVNGERDPGKKANLHQKVAQFVTKLEILGDKISEADSTAGPTIDTNKGGPQPAAGVRPKNLVWRREPAGAASISRLIPTAEELAARQHRKQRFAADGCTHAEEDQRLDVHEAGAYGTSQAVEKEYLRLTSLPLAANVRPPHVLHKALELVKSRWLEGPDYGYACEQLKSIRQDLTVQHIRGPLAIAAYEVHARIALEVEDLAEFRQCQNVLMLLYRGGDGEHTAANEDEFVAYGLLFSAAHGPLALASALRAVPQGLLGQPCISHAIQVCSAFRLGDCTRLVHLYATAPRMSPYLMDPLLARLRPWTLRAGITAHHPTPIPLTALMTWLGFDTTAEVADFCTQQGAVLSEDMQTLDCKQSRAKPAGPPRPT